MTDPVTRAAIAESRAETNVAASNPAPSGGPLDLHHLL
jgi:hypothetical protein